MMQDRNDDPLDFDTVLSIILDKHALYMRDVVSEFYETADVSRNHKKFKFSQKVNFSLIFNFLFFS